MRFVKKLLESVFLLFAVVLFMFALQFGRRDEDDDDWVVVSDEARTKNKEV